MRKLILPIFVTCLAAIAQADEAPFTSSSSYSQRETYYNEVERRRAHNERVFGTRPNSESNLGTGVTYSPDQVRTEEVRNFYLVPNIGMELANLSPQMFPGDTRVATAGGDHVHVAPAFGATGGWRLGYFNLGARYQGSIFSDYNAATLVLNKVYGEFGFNARSGNVLLSGFIDAGWAFAHTRGELTNGLGGKAGFGIDFLVNRYLTIGPGISFDAHAYRPNEEWLVAYGGTANLRVGFQL